ncbi:hypothetical protein JCM3770_001832, partial [Rhodotorula araucariae]
TDDDDDDALPSSAYNATPAYGSRPPSLPRKSYFENLRKVSRQSRGPAKPKSKLLITDLDNTLFGPAGDGVIARPYLRTFIRYIMHPDTPYNLAIWTFSGRQYGIAHLRQVGMGKYLFDSDDRLSPKKKPGLLAIWGYEDSGFLGNGQMAAGRPLKDLDLMWEMLNVTTGSDWNASNSLIQDDQSSNARAQPDSIVHCPVFTCKSPDDDFLLAQIGVLEELATASNMAAEIKRADLEYGIPLEALDGYVQRAIEVCKALGIKVSRGTPYPEPAVINDLKENARRAGPSHDAAPEPAFPHPGALPLVHPVPKRIATGMTLEPSARYLSAVAAPTSATRPGHVGQRLVIFDLDGTLYTRPPQHLEHIPAGEPAGRPYLRSFLIWLLRPDSPWTMAIWTGSQKATAVQCLYELDLGLVGPNLVDGEAELLHPKLVALWAREDFGLTPKDFVSYVAVVKDLDKMWSYLAEEHLGAFSPSNTVMVDDTPSKLRAQPATLIAAPTYDYPRAPSPYTAAAQLDTFLLALADMLDELAEQTNFGRFIAQHAWNKVPARRELADRTEAGIALLERAGVPVEAAARGVLPGTNAPRRGDAGGRTASKGITMLHASPPAPTHALTPRSAGLSRSASVIVTSRRPSLRIAPAASPPLAARPITFALPPPTASHSHAHGAGSPTTPSHERGNPLAASPTSFLNRLSRKLSQGRTNLVRRVSKGAKGTTSPTSSQAVSVHAADKENRTSAVATGELTQQSQLAGGGGLKRGLRVSAPTMRRSRSEGKRAPRVPNEEQKMQELVARANGYVEMQVPPVAGEATDGKSYVGSYFYSDTLGLCWDGREEVRPDTTFAFQRYTSDSDVIAKRAVFASTLSSFPPRPPLRPRTPPELTPASKIIAEYRATHSPIAPSVRSRALSDADECDEPELETPTAQSHALTPLAADQRARVPSPTGSEPMNPFDAAPELDLSRSSPTSPFSAAGAHTARSFASSSASSVLSDSEVRFRFGSGSETSGAGGDPASAAGHAGLSEHAREDSATSLESLAGPATRAKAPVPPCAPSAMQRFQLVDDGPVPRPHWHARCGGGDVDAASTVVATEEWQECE